MIVVYLLAIVAGGFMLAKGYDMAQQATTGKKCLLGLVMVIVGTILLVLSVGVSCDRCTEPSHGDDYFDTWTGKPKNPFPFGYPVY